jgi:hypothetical protein
VISRKSYSDPPIQNFKLDFNRDSNTCLPQSAHQYPSQINYTFSTLPHIPLWTIQVSNTRICVWDIRTSLVGAIHEAVSAKAEAVPTPDFANANALLSTAKGLARQDKTLPLPAIFDDNGTNILKNLDSDR